VVSTSNGASSNHSLSVSCYHLLLLLVLLLVRRKLLFQLLELLHHSNGCSVKHLDVILHL
jgi:hypothetical protein